MYRNRNILEKLPFAPVVGGMFGLVAAFLVMAAPIWLLAKFVVASGLPSILPPATPPLGQTARLLMAMVLGSAVGVSLWALVHFAERFAKRGRAPKPVKAKGERIGPILAPPSRRKPIFAEAELGAPFMSDEAMEVARNELILETPAVEAIESAPMMEAQPEAIVAPVAPGAAHGTPPARFARPTELDSIPGLMARLESALALRQSLSTPGKPIPAGDIASLRRALGAAG
jgi:hypothetical protein